ncbi:hypothetical protein BU14_0303s0003 [Porphyra umbilicalis]|uniref:Uncharacterized protein n=1 Tax=Porphyra umbilicalis TaxID=2786 RepID=A0A1X6NZX5_PORUM|nr:hypothetical protein BU14_0303s0003 [Porphyra umbilicalis]|eukprot:OSX74171.1 hypothetical protein BU14_0303s0003 [Porphyra umbilicalis]
MHRVKRAAFRPLQRKRVEDDEHQELNARMVELRRDMERSLELLTGAHRCWRGTFRNAAAFAAHTATVHGQLADAGEGVKGLASGLDDAVAATQDADAAVIAASRGRRSRADGDEWRDDGSRRSSTDQVGVTATALARRVRGFVQECNAMKADLKAAAETEKEAALYERKVAALEGRHTGRRGDGKHEDRLARNIDKREDAAAARDAAVDNANRRMRELIDAGGTMLEAVVLAYWSLFSEMTELAETAGGAGRKMVRARAERALHDSPSGKMSGLRRLFHRSRSSSSERGRQPASGGGRRSHSGSRTRRRSRSGSRTRRRRSSSDERRRQRSGEHRRRSRSREYRRSGEGRRSGERRKSGLFRVFSKGG